MESGSGGVYSYIGYSHVVSQRQQLSGFITLAFHVYIGVHYVGYSHDESQGQQTSGLCRSAPLVS